MFPSLPRLYQHGAVRQGPREAVLARLPEHPPSKYLRGGPSPSRRLLRHLAEPLNLALVV